MKSTLTKEEYKEFTDSLTMIKEKANITIAHSVEYKGDKFIVEILDDVDVEHLDNILLDMEN